MDIKLKDFLCMVQGTVMIELPVTNSIITVNSYAGDVLANDVLELNVDYVKPCVYADVPTLYICVEED